MYSRVYADVRVERRLAIRPYGGGKVTVVNNAVVGQEVFTGCMDGGGRKEENGPVREVDGYSILSCKRRRLGMVV